MTVKEAQRKVNSIEFSYWIAYFISEFQESGNEMPGADKPKTQQQTPEDMLAVAKMYSKLRNEEIVNAK